MSSRSEGGTSRRTTLGISERSGSSAASGSLLVARCSLLRRAQGSLVHAWPHFFPYVPRDSRTVTALCHVSAVATSPSVRGFSEGRLSNGVSKHENPVHRCTPRASRYSAGERAAGAELRRPCRPTRTGSSMSENIPGRRSAGDEFYCHDWVRRTGGSILLQVEDMKSIEPAVASALETWTASGAAFPTSVSQTTPLLVKAAHRIVRT